MLGSLTARQIEQLLETEVVARIGCHAEGRTYVVPITYAYDHGALVGHSAEGLKLRIMRANPEVCVEVDHMDDLANWRSVIAWGRFEELHGAAAAAAIDLLLTRFDPLMVSATSHPAPSDEAAPTQSRAGNAPAVLYRIRLDERTGRFERS